MAEEKDSTKKLEFSSISPGEFIVPILFLVFSRKLESYLSSVADPPGGFYTLSSRSDDRHCRPSLREGRRGSCLTKKNADFVSSAIVQCPLFNLTHGYNHGR